MKNPLNRLKAGNINFVNDHLNNNFQDSSRRKEMVSDQHPFAVILTCSDSRVVPELIFDTGIGELFVIRVAGNIANTSSIASIEYEVAHLNVKLIVMLGHQNCGAVTAALADNNNGKNLDRLCFKKDGFLRSEFNNIFASLFDQHDNHEAIIRVLASVRKGLTRTEILTKSKIKSGGTLTKVLLELEESGFIEKYVPYQGTKDSIYRLTDEYSMFYIKFIEKTKPSNGDIWIKTHGQQSYKIWSGFSFETICIKHVEQIKEGLKISGINAVHGSWIEKKTPNSAQIDLLIDRDDNVINLCEMKFYNTEYTINKKYANEIAKKVNAFLNSTKSKKSVFVTFITSYGLITNKYSSQYVQNELTIDHLFFEV